MRQTAYRSFLDQLATLLEGGVPVLEALRGLASSPHGAAARLAGDLLPGVGAGRSIAASMDAAGRFPRAHVAVMEAGERAGAVPAILRRLRDEVDRRIQAQRVLLGRLIRPVGMLIAVAVLFPLPMLFTGEVGAFIGIEVAVFGSVAALGALAWRGRARIHGVLGSLPVVGPALRRAALGESLSLLGLIVGAGIGVREALHIVAGAARRADLSAGLRSAAAQLDAGQDLAGAIGPLLGRDTAALSVIATGEKAGSMDRGLEAAGQTLEEAAARSLQRILLAIPVVLMILVGVVIGWVYIQRMVEYYDKILEIR